MCACFNCDIGCNGRRTGKKIRSGEAHHNAHGPTALGAGPEIGNMLGSGMDFDGRGRWCRAEQFKTQRQQSGAPPIGKKTEVSDTDETLWQKVEQETPQELICRKRHELLAVAVRAVSPEECDIAILKRDEAAVGNGHSMRVAAKITENMFRAAERRSAVNHPLVPEQLTDKGAEHLRV